ncbi:MAG: hypothetical protein PHV68_05970, partial [Candidatus Gastranaerophilales bacterium]|nr:hypothetical protein [Candidatus Gastranaerophilales bacterium]
KSADISIGADNKLKLDVVSTHNVTNNLDDLDVTIDNTETEDVKISEISESSTLVQSDPTNFENVARQLGVDQAEIDAMNAALDGTLAGAFVAGGSTTSRATTDDTIFIALASDGNYHIYSNFIRADRGNSPHGRGGDSQTATGYAYIAIVAVENGSNNLYRSSTVNATISSTEPVLNDDDVETNIKQVDTVAEYDDEENATINNGVEIEIEGFNAVLNNKDIAHIIETKTTYEKTGTIKSETTETTTSNGNQWTGSPLIFDMDGDGVEAEHGIGVDINGDGKADGAASGGDKMLSMGDLNGDGIIDGTEVFGDQTINPFTGEKIGAANGFEALRIIAEEAEKLTGINVIEDGFVDIQALSKAFEEFEGISLGLISGDNVTELEGLGGISKVDVAGYEEVDENGKIQHRQQSSYTDIFGNTHKVDDV